MTMSQTLYLIRGLPGAGKTTLARIMIDGLRHTDRILNLPPAQLVSADDFRLDANGRYVFDASKNAEVHEACYAATIKFLKEGHSVIVHNTFVRKWEMARYYDYAKAKGISVMEIILPNVLPFGNEHGVPEETIQRMKERFEY